MGWLGAAQSCLIKHINHVFLLSFKLWQLFLVDHVNWFFCLNPVCIALTQMLVVLCLECGLLLSCFTLLLLNLHSCLKLTGFGLAFFYFKLDPAFVLDLPRQLDIYALFALEVLFRTLWALCPFFLCTLDTNLLLFNLFLSGFFQC